jgi:glycerol-3-phosphate acyltransferase PlsY
MKFLLVAVIAYLIGNISFSLLISKVFFKDDVRKHGSGNAGSTNMIRAFGFKIGVITFIGDVLKGILAAYIGKLIAGIDGAYIAGILVVAGHNWPVFMNFKGGKGVATTLGMLFVVIPWITLICSIIGLTIAFMGRIVSIGSLIGVVLSAIVAISRQYYDVKFVLFALVYASMCLFTHRHNIKRLLRGEENKL